MSDKRAAQAQPKALYLLFMTELWERFGFFTLVSIFAFYLVERLKVERDEAFLIFSTFVSFSYLATVVGGVAADRVLGFGRAILTGAALIAVGYLLLGLGGEAWLYLALGFLAVGNGLFKGNVSALLGRFYADEDPRRAPGFTLFYIGINVGVLAGSLLAGVVAEAYGYGWAFVIAGLGKLIALVTYLIGRRLVRQHDRPPPGLQRPRWALGLTSIALLIAVACSALLLSRLALAGWAIAVIGLGMAGSYVLVILRQEGPVRNRLLVHLALTFFSIVFWAVYQQYAISVTLFAQQDVDREIMGWVMPSSSTTSLGALALLLLSPLVTLLWPWLERRGVIVGDLARYCLGLVWLGLAYLLLSLVVDTSAAAGKASMLWILLFYGLLGLGEIFLAPLGLALTTRLAPKHLAGYAMGMWFFAVAAAIYLAGVLAVPQGTAGEPKLTVYEADFLLYGLGGLGGALLLLLALPWLHRPLREERGGIEAG